jgi:pimeloyl-ACP methyl ester carboxylesterase
MCIDKQTKEFYMKKVLLCAIFGFISFLGYGQVPASKFVTVDGIKLEYVDWGGSGEYLLLLAGAGNTASTFDDFAANFTSGYHVVAVTRRGFGQSSKPETGYQIEVLAEDIRKFMDALNIRSAHFMGHSFAGAEITHLASVHPHRVRKIIYLDALGDFAEQSRIILTSKDVPDFYKKRLEQALAAEDNTTRQSDTLEGEEKFNLELMKSIVRYRMNYRSVKAPVLAFFMAPKEHFAISPDLEQSKKDEMNKWWRENGIPYIDRQIAKAKSEFSIIKVVTFDTSNHFLHQSEKKAEIIELSKSFLKG